MKAVGKKLPRKSSSKTPSIAAINSIIMSMNILVTGGAGYIGSFMTKALLDRNYQVAVIDNLVRGHKNCVDKRANFLEGDLLDATFLKHVFENHFDAVIHFAGYIAVNESMKDPGLYFRNNITGSLNLLEAMRKNNVKNIIFSSTGTVYGMPQKIPIPETHPINPDNPYAESKVVVEKILRWYEEIYGVSFAILRYFNACGAALNGTLGESHDPETHIIPNAIKAAISGHPFNLYGTDYNTRDGTCIRDYIHVLDLVEAHVLALEKIQKDPGGYIYNVGTGTGTTNREIIDKVKEISGKDFQVVIEGRREGDTEEIVADTKKINEELGFEPKHSDLNTIINSAWKFHTKNR